MHRKQGGEFPLRVILVIFLAFSFSRNAFADPQGPVRFDALYPLDAGHLSFSPRSGFLLPPGQLSVRVAGGTSNTSIVKDEYRIDTENRALLVEVGAGLSQDYDISLGLPLHWRGGGVLDSFLDGWHKAFGLPRRRRDRIADDRFLVSLGVGDDERVSWTDDGVALGNPKLEVQHDLCGRENHGCTAYMAVSLPAQSSSQGHRGTDLLLGFVARDSWSQVWLYGGVGMGAIGDTDLYGVEYDPIFGEVFGALEVPLFEDIRFSTAIWGGTSKVRNVATHPDGFIYFDLGFKFSTPFGLFELLLRENPWPQDGTPDVLGVVGYSKAFTL